ncbi:hypothetical protein FJZ22_00255 [Candidatus Pacearchaeota archaeon]|nr:hypothetical protein [Candidatus Pacearchaeota archaeon]
MRVSKNYLYWGVIVLCLLTGYFLFFSDPVLVSGETQNLTLSLQQGNYYPETISVQVGVPVALTLDASVKGCFRSFSIPALQIIGYSRSPAEPIVFTPTKKGTYEFRCTMGMGTGTLIVK